MNKTKAIILAAGLGTRMKEYTVNTPKPMLPLRGKPMIEYTVRQLKACGISDIAMNLYYHADQITNYFKSGEEFGVNISYVHEKAPSGTAGGVKKLENFCADAENIIVIYGDIITDLDYRKLLDSHQKSKALATICIHQRKTSNSIIEFDQNLKIVQFLERPSDDVLAQYKNGIWVNSAIYCIKPAVLKEIKSNTTQDFPKDIFPVLLGKNQLFAYKIDAKRYAIDSEERYLDAEKNFQDFQFLF